MTSTSACATNCSRRPTHAGPAGASCPAARGTTARRWARESRRQCSSYPAPTAGRTVPPSTAHRKTAPGGHLSWPLRYTPMPGHRPGWGHDDTGRAGRPGSPGGHRLAPAPAPETPSCPFTSRTRRGSCRKRFAAAGAGGTGFQWPERSRWTKRVEHRRGLGWIGLELRVRLSRCSLVQPHFTIWLCAVAVGLPQNA